MHTEGIIQILKKQKKVIHSTLWKEHASLALKVKRYLCVDIDWGKTLEPGVHITCHLKTFSWGCQGLNVRPSYAKPMR